MTAPVKLLRPLVPGETRTPEQIRASYEIERELADRLRRAGRTERRALYAPLYDELYRRSPDHPQVSRKASPDKSREAVELQMNLLARFLRPDQVFLEVGPGDCALAFEVCRRVRSVIAVDVSDAITSAARVPENFRLILSDGVDIPVPEGSLDLIYSHQLMEHLHPEDALEQLTGILRALRPGGQYLCLTPNRLNGPHDDSQYFERVAAGFHLKEYTVTELNRLLRRAGFSKVRNFAGGRGRYLSLPLFPLAVFEALFSLLPFGLRVRLGRTVLFRSLLGIRVLAVK